MLKIVFVALFYAQVFARPSSDYPFETLVVGGIPADEGQFPFIVSLWRADRISFLCGGALISDRYVLTAAHCFRDEPSIVGIGAGSVNLETQKIYEIDRIIVHPAFNKTTTSNDIALVRLSSPIPLGGNVQTILPFTNNDDQLVGESVTAMGWGRTSRYGPSSMRLLYLKKSIVTNDFCRERVQSVGYITPGNICMGSEFNYGMCFGDSGSPLAYKAPDNKTYIVGIVSWGVPCAVGYPDVFTRVSYYAKWIEENMK